MTLEQLVESFDLESVPENHALDTTLMPTLAPRIRQTQGERSVPPRPKRKTLQPPAKDDRDSNALRVKGPLAEGGMGTIKLAEQAGLRREVAVKTLRDPFLESAFAARLLREGRILGLVEHPNVVPLYGFSTDERNAPMLIMKRIEGVPWRALIRDPKHPAFPSDADDRLAWQLQVLMRVCDAVHYAHSRGVLHLDLKPDNVMIGAFREVVLLDWGVAVCTDDKYRDWLPMADEICEVLGTPAYLAPEMVDVGRQALTPRTDVYLLGACLHEILVGRPPHKGENLQQLLYAAYDAQIPIFPDEVPIELAAICQKAMNPDPAERYESAEAMRRAIRDFRSHRFAQSLATNALAELEELERLIGEALDSPSHIRERSSERNAKIQRVFGRCRFGLAESLRHWPHNPETRPAQTRALLAMARYHLHRGEAASAETLLEELDGVTEAEPLREEARDQRQRAAELERKDQEEHLDPGRRARGKMLLGGAMLAILGTTAAYVLGRADVYQYQWWNTLVFDVSVPLFFGIGGLLGRGMTTSKRSKRTLMTLIVLGLLAVLLRVVGVAMGLRDLRSTVLELFFFGAGAVLAGVMADRRFYIAAPGLFLGAMLVLFVPEHAQLFLALAILLGPVPLGLAWLRSDSTGRSAPKD